MIMAINRCIDFTKASKGLKLVPRNETFILRDIITLPLKCMQNIQQWIIITKKEIPDDICSHIITDQHWLQENVLCLLSNAVKYSHQGVVELSIILVQHEKYISVEQNHDKNSSCHVHSLLGIDNARSREDCTIASKDSSRKGSYQHQPLRSFLRFEVQDCGIGVGEEAAKRLFRPFNQTQRLAGGTGLGLYSLAKRVDALGGYYGVHSRPDGLKGSVCWFEIPYKADGNAASFQKDFIVLNTSPISIAPIDTSSQLLAHNTTVTSKTDEDSLTPSTNSEKHHILIVDDSPTIAKMTAMLLHRAGYEVSIAENGEVALQMIQKRYATDASLYYLILMDLQMPILDGLETMKRICSWENEVLSNAKKNVLLAVSANSDDETIKEACLAGANDFVPKPFTMEYFTHILYKYDNVQYLLDE